MERSDPIDLAPDTIDATIRREALVQLPDIVLERELGRGGMAAVYEGREQELGNARRVAVKLMLPDLSADAEFRSRFDREASIVAGFQHDNIVRIYKFGEVAGTKYIVMEFLPGGTLAEKIRAGALAPAEAFHTAAQLASALTEAHEAGVIHRDFKPGNVLFTAKGKPVLSDFGIAKTSLATDGELTQKSTVMGALRYMAPEQGRGDRVTDRADVYSFGLTLFEMITARLPAHEDRVLRKPGDGKDIQSVFKSISPEVGELVCRCLLFDPAARPSAADCLAALSSAQIPRKTGWRHPWVLPAAALLVTGGALALGSLLRSGPGTPASTAAALLSVERMPASAKLFLDGALLDGTPTRLATGTHELIAVAPGYYGEVRSIEHAKGQPVTPVNMVLAPTQLPSLKEERHFLELADRPTLSDSDVSSIADRTFETALRTKLLRNTGRTQDYERVTRDVDQLQRFGDARAAVTSLLIASVQEGHVSRNQITEPLKAASRSGDAMATLFLALAYRDSIDATGSVSLTDPKVIEYCGLVKQAMEQGWADVAADYWRRDHCGT